MNILHIFKTYYPESYGGVEQVINTICESTSADFEYRVITLTKKDQRVEKINGYDVYFYPLTFEFSSNGLSWPFLKHYAKHVEWADIIHFHYPWPFADLCHLIKQFPNKKKVVTYHSDIVKQKYSKLLYKPLEQRFLNNLDCIVATSDNYVESSPNLQRFKEKVEVIPIGIEELSTPLFCKKFDQVTQQKYFLFVGVLRYYKGLESLVKALVDTDIHIIIAGDGPEKNKLIELSQKLNVAHQIEFIGSVTEQEKAFLLQHAYGFVFPSHVRSEAFGISLLEAASYSLPLISCEIGTGTSFVNIDQQTGYVIEPDHPQQLQQAMQKLWDNSSLTKKLGQQAYQRFQSLFTSKIMIEQYQRLYKKLLCGSSE